MKKEVTYHQIKSLLEILANSKEKKLEHLAQSYKQQADNLDGTLGLLQDLHILSVVNGQVSLVHEAFLSTGEEFSDEFVKKLLVTQLLNATGLNANPFSKYLKNFASTGDNFEYRPTTSQRVKDSANRNLLIELELVQYNEALQVYSISSKFHPAFAIFLNRQSLSTKQLARSLKQKELLGLAAEHEILKYERKRLTAYPNLCSRIEHIAQDNVMAGYDILSWEEERQNSPHIPRYIEVKAVSRPSFQFYWSRNEVECAKRYGARYYLYLLPVARNLSFDSELKIISNPIKMVFANKLDWKMSIESYNFSLKSQLDYEVR